MSILNNLENTRQVLVKLKKSFRNKKCVVTGGASFIGSHLVDSLISMESFVTVIDDFSSGKINNLNSSFNNSNLILIEKDITLIEDLDKEFSGADFVFNLAAIHGGRCFIESQGKLMLKNLYIDQKVFQSAINEKVKVIIHASSACSYPINFQSSSSSRNLLSENLANFEIPGGAFPDGIYGWTKLMGEFQLKTLTEKTATKGRSARIFTDNGPRENESHAAIALISKAILRMDPFEIWGDGNQTRNFTFVADTVSGLLFAAADPSEDYYAFNIGTSDHIQVNNFVEEIFSIVGRQPQVIHRDINKPAGVASRASNNDFVFKKFGWQPSININEGIKETYSWYLNYRDRAKDLNQLISRLNSR